MSLNSFSSCLVNSRLVFKWNAVSVLGTSQQVRARGKSTPRYMVPKLKYPSWYVPQFRVRYDEELTSDNEAFVKEVVHEKYGPPAVINGLNRYLQSPLKTEPAPRGEWFPGCRRSGLIALKIGVYPQWTSDGKKFFTTLLQVIDNHVINYYPPGEFDVNRKKLTKRFKKEGKMGCLVVGAISQDPQNFTKDYCGLFNKSGVMPKKHLTRFIIHPEAAIQPGTPLNASHFRIGDCVDVTGKTIDRGFQGVMKRWGFHGQPATHGQTKTHRRPGNIGAGGQKARVLPGTKMPGHMGNRTRVLKGLKIWRINHEYNVLYVVGQNVPGDTNTIVFIHDTILPLTRCKTAPPFPTYYPEDNQEPRPAEEKDPKLFDFNGPSLVFEEPKVEKKRKR